MSTALTDFSAATLLESGATPLPPAVRPLDHAQRVAGPARVVRLAAGHNVWLHRAVYAARPGDVLVAGIDPESDHADGEFGYWGEILATAARIRGVAGLVIDGSVRDRTELVELGFPVFARGLSVRGTGKDPGVGGIGGTVAIEGALIADGDVVVGDADGVVVVPADQVDQVAERAARRVESERRILERLAAGQSTLDVYGLR